MTTVGAAAEQQVAPAVSVREHLKSKLVGSPCERYCTLASLAVSGLDEGAKKHCLSTVGGDPLGRCESDAAAEVERLTGTWLQTAAQVDALFLPAASSAKAPGDSTSANCDIEIDRGALLLDNKDVDVVQAMGSPSDVVPFKAPSEKQIFDLKFAKALVYGSVRPVGAWAVGDRKVWFMDDAKNIVGFRTMTSNKPELMPTVADAAPWAVKTAWDGVVTIGHSTLAKGRIPQVSAYKVCGDVVVMVGAACFPRKNGVDANTYQPTFGLPSTLAECAYAGITVFEKTSTVRTDAKFPTTKFPVTWE